MPHVTIIIPVYNEADNIVWLTQSIQKNIQQISNNSFSLLFVDDGSLDDSVKTIQSLQKKHKNIDLIVLSRNFGKEAALTAGLQHAKGEAVIIMDADGQHPAEKLPAIMSLWQSSKAEMVIGIRDTNTREGITKKYGSKLFYWLISKLSPQQEFVVSATDFRLVGRTVLNDFEQFTERERSVRALLDWVGYKRTYFHFDAPQRNSGTASYSTRKLLALAINSITSFSVLPLYLSIYIGIFTLVMSVSMLATMFIEQIVLNDPLNLNITGGAYLLTFTLGLVGVLMLTQGMIALYIGKIFTESLNRPIYLIDKKRSTIS